ncbi:hypothetical protein PHYBOEH_003616 [Phytophthora boehmeriae]|uniref:FYVE-type domain-containing protein n=1 Tax=Phytophthora boehmeriae TaxID=109152 RepID=A0A8T1WSH3_9STRA|nr:hypothetical protein PHYBOEH_003616 [Phytophthora boehmeriae]
MAHSLSKDERLQCDRRSEALLSETLAALAGFDSSRLDPTEWRLLARRGQVAVHRALSANHGAAGTHRRRAVGSGFLDGTLNDIVGGLYVENDADLLTTQALLSPSGNTVADAAVLLIEERRQPRAAPFRFAGVKWYSWKKKLSAGQNANGAGQKANAAANLSVDSQECDLLTYERMGMALTEDRGTGGMQELVYHVQLSLHKPEWPLDVARGPGLRRAEMAMCFLYRKVSDDLVECFTLVDYDSRVSATSRRTADSEVADRVLMVTRLPDCARAKVFSTFANKVKGRPVMMSKMCLRCGSKRKVLDLLRTCCICKKSVCQKCFELKPVFSVNSRTHEPETDAFCNKCITRIEIMRAAKNTTANKTSGSTDGGSSTSGSSKDRDKENNSGGSTGSSSKKTFKFWRKSKDKLQANQEQQNATSKILE